jgi:hypothetical protein
MTAKPPLRLIHHLARSGGTILCKCLGSMSDVVLLSEVNPAAVAAGVPLEPLFQAAFWFRLFKLRDVEAMARTGMSFVDRIAVIAERCAARGDILVLRDWTFVDFLGKPYVDQPSYRLGLAECLRDRFELRQVATVRHPLDQWLSWQNFRREHHWQHPFTFDEFIRACRRFAEQAVAMRWYRYEDFARDRDRVLTAICGDLQIPFDPRYASLWPLYHTITGDVQGARGQKSIEPPPRREKGDPVPVDLDRHEDYQATLRLLGYT